MQKINHWAVLVAVVINQAFGALWYGLLSEPWLQAIGKTRDEIDPHTPVPYIIAIIAAFAVTYKLAFAYKGLSIESMMKALTLALMSWLAFYLLPTLTHGSFAGSSQTLLGIDAVATLFNFVIAAVILSVWKKRA